MLTKCHDDVYEYVFSDHGSNTRHANFNAAQGGSVMYTHCAHTGTGRNHVSRSIQPRFCLSAMIIDAELQTKSMNTRRRGSYFDLYNYKLITLRIFCTLKIRFNRKLIEWTYYCNHGGIYLHTSIYRGISFTPSCLSITPPAGLQDFMLSTSEHITPTKFTS